MASDSGSSRPNIVLVHCHDLGRHLHCYGVPTVHSPNLDALAASGVRFDRAFATAPQCSPSRASMVTGRFPHSHGVMGLSQSNFAWDLHDGERHVAELLRDAGYRTGIVGLHHAGRCGAVQPAAFSTQQAFATEEEIAVRCGFEHAELFGRAEEVADRSIAELHRASRCDRPFFLEIGFGEPHRRKSLIAPDPDYEGFVGDYIEPDDSLGVTVPPYLRDEPFARRDFTEFQGAVRYLDTHAGRVFREIERLGLGEHTLVVFTTDHGIAMTRAKSTLYDAGIGIALIFRFPARGWVGGRVQRELTSNVDIVPTLLDAAGVPPQPAIQGHSLACLLDGMPGPVRDSVFGEMSYQNYYDPRRCIRTDRHKLIVYFTASVTLIQQTGAAALHTTPVTPERLSGAFHPLAELFDLHEDPEELDNVIDRPAYRQVRDELLRRLYRWMRDTGDPLLDGAIAAPMHGWALRVLREASAAVVAKEA